MPHKRNSEPRRSAPARLRLDGPDFQPTARDVFSTYDPRSAYCRSWRFPLGIRKRLRHAGDRYRAGRDDEKIPGPRHLGAGPARHGSNSREWNSRTSIRSVIQCHSSPGAAHRPCPVDSRERSRTRYPCSQASIPAKIGDSREPEPRTRQPTLTGTAPSASPQHPGANARARTGPAGPDNRSKQEERCRFIHKMGLSLMLWVNAGSLILCFKGNSADFWG